MKKNHQIIMAVSLMLLAIFSLIQVREKGEYESYLRQENRNSISVIIANIKRIDDVLEKYEETGEITYSEISSVGMKYLNAENYLSKLYRQECFFEVDRSHSSKAYNDVLKYFDGVSMFISMDVLHTTGNHYPYAYNEEIYILNEDVRMVLNNISELNRTFVDVIKAEGFLDNPQGSMENYVVVDTKNNGLETLDHLVVGIADETNLILDKQTSYADDSIIEKFFDRVR